MCTLVVEYNGFEAWDLNWGYGTFFSGLSRKAELKTLHAADLVVTVSSAYYVTNWSPKVSIRSWKLFDTQPCRCHHVQP